MAYWYADTYESDWKPMSGADVSVSTPQDGNGAVITVSGITKDLPGTHRHPTGTVRFEKLWKLISQRVINRGKPAARGGLQKQITAPAQVVKSDPG